LIHQKATSKRRAVVLPALRGAGVDWAGGGDPRCVRRVAARG